MAPTGQLRLSEQPSAMSKFENVFLHTKKSFMEVDEPQKEPYFKVLLSREENKTSASLRQRKLHSPLQFSYEAMRLATFDCWATSFMDKNKLAENGFIYLRTKDLVMCFFCKGVVGFWEIGDEPMKEHQKHFPNCPLVQGQDTANIPISDMGTGLNSFLNKYLQFSLDYLKPQHPLMKYQTDSVAVTQSKPAYSSFSSYECRLQTFKEWSKDGGIPVMEKMAEAGFFHSGTSDFVICFFCGGGLFNWNATDDPMVDHVSYYEFCPFVRMKTSPSSISPVPESSQNIWSCKLNAMPCRSKFLSEDEEDLLLRYSFSKRLVVMGLSPNSIKKALSDFLQTFAYLPSSLMNCIEVIIDWEDEQQKRNSESRSSEEKKVASVQSTHASNSSTTTMSKCDSSESGRLPQLLDEVNALRKAIEEENNQFICRKCKERTVEVLLLPCNHFQLCKTCSAEYVKCPSCNVNIRGAIYPIVSK